MTVILEHLIEVDHDPSLRLLGPVSCTLTLWPPSLLPDYCRACPSTALSCLVVLPCMKQAERCDADNFTVRLYTEKIFWRDVLERALAPPATGQAGGLLS